MSLTGDELQEEECLNTGSFMEQSAEDTLSSKADEYLAVLVSKATPSHDGLDP